MKGRFLPTIIAGAAALSLAGFIAFVNLNVKPAQRTDSGSGTPVAAKGEPASSALPAAGSGNPATAKGESATSVRPGTASGAGKGNGAGGNRAGGVPPIVVDAVDSAYGRLESNAKLTGEVQAFRTLRAYPDTAGRLSEVPVAAGTRVDVGTIVAYVDPSRPGSRFEPSPVRAPIAGTVVSVLLDPGANVTTSSAIVEIATVSELDVVVRVPERWAPEVVVGTVAEVVFSALPGRRFPARVRSADPVIDPVSRSKRVLLRLSGDASRIEPGMFAEVLVALSKSSSALVIPIDAVVNRGGSDLVYVIENGVARERAVRIGRFSDTGAEVLDGVKVGERVIVRGQNLIRDGSRVTEGAR